MHGLIATMNPALRIIGAACAVAGLLTASLALAQQPPAPAGATPTPGATPTADAPASASAPVSPAISGAGQVTHLSGTLVGRTDGQTQPRLLAVRSWVVPGETVATQGDTYARVRFNDGTEIVLRPNSQFKVEAYAFDEKEPSSDNLVFSLLKGGLRSISGLISRRNRDRIQYKTPTATVGIRGTHFGMLMCSADCANVPTVTGTMPADGLHVDVAAGQIVVTNPAGTQTLNPGQFGYVPSTQSAPTIVPPQSGVRVTMPAVIAAGNTGGRSVGNPQAGQAVCRP